MLATLFKHPEKYSINLMWIKRTLDNKPYICGYESEEDLLEKFLDVAKKWKKANPEAEVNIWYDSQFITPQSLAATLAVLEKKAQESPFYNIKLRDIREIDVVKNNPDAFSDNIPLYFRIDLMKLIICVNSIEIDSNEAAIFADLEVGDYRATKDRMSKNDLFNPEIMKNLNVVGIQFNLHDSCRIENQFIQVLNKPITLKAMKVYINACLSRAIKALNLGDNYNLANLSTAVFDMQEEQLIPLIEMCAYNREVLVNIGLLKTGAGEKWVKYEIEKHGYLPLGNYFLRNYKNAYFLKKNYIGNSISYRKILKLPRDSISDNFGISFARRVEVRPGRDHVEDVSKLVRRVPADGSKVYKFRPQIIKKAIQPSSHASSKRPIIAPLPETPVSLVADEARKKIKEKNFEASSSIVSTASREFTPQRNHQRRKRQTGVVIPLRWSKRIAAKQKGSSKSFVAKRG